MALSDKVKLTRRSSLAMLVAVALLAGCGHRAKPAAQSGLFDNQDQATISCLKHQSEQPGPLYTGGQSADTAHILQMMQYFTSNGAKPYCDGAKATAIDQTWAKLYLSLGGTSHDVRAVLGSS
ncbi:MAG: hypothetical protein M3Y42_10290 [Actinomycetota bacterium]|nr:hypothetical protein [Actinomycetota bacterium]MDQ2957342.1 hypothetical protein [Actinomycetota bacterium]